MELIILGLFLLVLWFFIVDSDSRADFFYFLKAKFIQLKDYIFGYINRR